MKKGLVNEDNYKDDVTFIYCATVEKHIKAGGEKNKTKKTKQKKKHFGSFSSSTSNVSVTRSMEESCSTSVNEHYCRLMNIALTIALLRRELFNKHLWFRRVVGTTTFQLYP